jgi:hypothetical protein
MSFIRSVLWDVETAFASSRPRRPTGAVAARAPRNTMTAASAVKNSL